MRRASARTCRMLLMVLSGWMAGGTVAHGAQATLVADAHVSTAQSSMNFGTLTNVAVGNGYTTLLQFDLSTLPAGTTPAQVSKAVLRLYANRVDTPGTLTLQQVGGAWGEYSVTAASMPALGATVGTVGPITTAGNYVTVDVTSVVQGWLTTPSTNQGLALTAGSAVVQLDSKENDLTSHPAMLEVTLASQGPAGPAGATGAVGLQGVAGVAGTPGPVGPAGATGAAGTPGLSGAAGPQGPQGLPGPAGPQGPAGAAGTMSYQGVWSSLISYPTSAVVTYAGSSYLSLVSANAGATPGLAPSKWGLLAAAGQNGSNGTSGGSSSGTALNYQGTYAASTSYAQGAVVTYAGSSYVSLTTPNTGNMPGSSTTFWGLLAAAGTSATTPSTTAQSLQYQGTYVSTTNYALGDIVQSSGSSYVSLLTGNHGNLPGTVATAWGLLAAAQVGAAGPQGPQGLVGPQGVQGVAGPVGPAGVQGPAGVAGPVGSPGLVFRGAYVSGTNYAVGDVVLWQGSAWTSLQASNVGNAPDVTPSFWAMLAQAGAAGPQGVQGPAGPMGPQGAVGPAGPVGAAGPQGSVGMQGPAGAQGVTGATGAVGASGPQGAPGVAGAAGAQGVAGPTGATGAQGVTGPQGPAGPTGLTMRGAYNSSTNYALGDGVLWNGAGYVSVVIGNQGNTPDASPSAWVMFAAAGSAGAAGPAGPAGAPGATGATGAVGPQGATGATGATGPQGPPVANYTGNYQSSRNYALNDAVSYGGSTYVSLVAGNAGNTPGQSAQQWAVLAAQGLAGPVGAAGATGAAGPQGPAGATGATGPQGPTGATGMSGAVGMTFRGAWASNVNYAVNDAVTDGGSSWIAMQSSTGVEPSTGSNAWGQLAAAGSAGATGASGVSATVSVGSVQTGAPGSAATVTNSGTTTAAVLNFVIPAGATGSAGSGSGSGGGSGTSGVPYMSVQHAVTFGTVYYPVNTATGASNETTAVLSWVPGGCTATKLSVYSLQANPVTVTLRSGMPGSMSSTGMSCVASNAGGCTAQGSVTVSAGSFVDLSITGANGTSSPVWTAVSCN